MANLNDVVFWFSLVVLFGLTIRDFFLSRRIALTLSYVALLLVCGALYFAFLHSGPRIEPKGDQPPQWPFILVLYICVLLGMAGNYLYAWFTTSRSARQPFDLRSFLAPMLISPIVFSPLLGAFQSADADLHNMTAPKLMIFLVTFENGFFWREIYENRRRTKKS